MKRFYISVGIIFLLLIVLSLLGYFYISKLDGFFINLITEIIGISVTVFIVERILSFYRKQEWEKTHKLILQQLKSLFSDIAMYIENIFNITDALSFSELRNKYPNISPWDIRIDYFTLKNHLLPEIKLMVKKFTPKEWEKMGILMQTVLKFLNEILMMYGEKLSPIEMETLIDLQNSTTELLGYSGIMFRNVIFPTPDSSEKSIIKFLYASLALGDLVINGIDLNDV